MKDSLDKVVLRPHHIVCIQHFVGRGYDEDFTANMVRVTNALTDDTCVQIALGTDTLCAACPHNTNGTCAEQSRVMRMDEACLKILNVSYGDVIPYRALVDAVTHYIEHEGGLPEVCSDCEWLDLCLKVRAEKSTRK